MNRATTGALVALLIVLMPATALAQSSHGGPCPTDVNCTGGVRNDTPQVDAAGADAKHVPGASVAVALGVLATSAVLLLALRKR